MKQGGFNQYDKDWFETNISEYRSFEEFVLNWVKPKNVLTGLHFVPQYKFITINHQLVMDDVFKLEELNKSFNSITKRLNLPDTQLPKLNKSKGDSNYKKLYSPKMIEIVKKVYLLDFQLLNY